MKTIALIQQPMDSKMWKWQFDKIMAVIAYDIEPIIVFMDKGIDQLCHNKAWKALSLYGIDDIRYLGNSDDNSLKPLLSCQCISREELKSLIKITELIL